MKNKSKFIICMFVMITILLSNISFAVKDDVDTIKIINERIKIAESLDTETNINADGVVDNVESNELNLYSEACVLVERSTQRFAYEKNADERMYPASITKILTAILVVENCNLDDTVTITNEMVSKVPAGYTTAYLRAGEQVTVEQLLNVLLIPSANDAGFALAIHISGSVEEFVNLMNEKATEIGCTGSHFTNPSGIHDEQHYSTARDMALIGMYATNYPQITNIGCKTSYVLQPKNSKSRTFETTNTLINPESNSYYEFATGLKTGFTEPAGSCLIATAKKDDMEFLAVILKAPEPEKNIVYRDEDCKALFEYGFTNYEDIVKVDEPIVTFPNKQIEGKVDMNIIFKVVLCLFGGFLFCVIIKIGSSKKCKKSV